MRTFIKTLTTGDDCNFDSVTFGQFSTMEKLTHLVRQSWGMKYLKFVYGDDLWFLFKEYANDLTNALADFKNQYISNNQTPLENATTELGLAICNNALMDPVVSIPLSVDVADFARFYRSEIKNKGNKIPEFGSSGFATTFYTHLKNMVLGVDGKKFTNENFRSSVIIPYNPLNPISGWKEVFGKQYKYDTAKIKKACTTIDIDPGYVNPFLQLLVSIDQASYLDSPESIIAILATFMIDPDYLNDYSGYLTALTGILDSGLPHKIQSTNHVIFKGCYRVLFDEIENSIFGILNRQCRVVVAEKGFGYTKPIVDNTSAKNLLWLLSYIKENAVTGFMNNNVLVKLITYFEPKILPADIPQLLTILHKVPDLSQAEQNLLLGSGFGSLFSGASPFSAEADEEADTGEEKEPKDENTDKDTEGDDNEMPDIDEGGIDDTSGDDDGGSDDSGSSDIGEGESSDPQQVLPDYLLELGAPPDLDNVLYRMELDRHITLILKNPPKNMPADKLKILQQIQSHWVHIISLPLLRLVIDSIFKKG